MTKKCIWLFLVVLVFSAFRETLTCNCSEPKEIQKLATELEKVKDWEKIGKELNINVDIIKENCAASVTLAQCHRRELVKAYCDMFGDLHQVKKCLADKIEEQKRQEQIHDDNDKWLKTIILLGLMSVFMYYCTGKRRLMIAATALLILHSLLIPKTTELSCYADYLRAVYSTSPIAISDKFPPTPSKQFMKLALVKKEKVSRAEADKFTRLTLQGDIDQILQVKEPIEMDDILKADDKVRLVVVEGAPGVGKSTLAWELCRQWSKLESLKQFSLVVLHRLREQDVQSATDISDLFPWENDPGLSSLVAQEVKRENGKGMLFVFDGFDEFPNNLRQSLDSTVIKVISGKLLPKATILVISRPSATADLQSVFQTSISKHIEIVGFSGTEIQNYAESIFGSGSEILASFNAYLSTNPFVKGMMYNPLNCAIVVGVYQDSYMTGKPVPHTQTQLYTELTLCLLSRSLNATGDPLVHELPDKLEDLPHDSDLYQQLVKVGELAYEGKLKDDVIFHQLPEGCSDLGLLVKHTALYTRKKTSHYSFFHVTLQEYMSAFYISQLQDSKQRALFNNHATSNSFNMVWKFVAGLTKMQSIGWDKFKGRRSMYIVEDNVLSVDLSLIQYFYEAQDMQSCETVFGHYRVAWTPFGNLIGSLFGGYVGGLVDGGLSPWSYSHLSGLGSASSFGPWYDNLLPQTFSSVFDHYLGSSSYLRMIEIFKKNMGPSMTLPDYFALGYCISACSNTWNITMSGMTAGALKLLGHGMKSVELGGSIDELDIFWSKEILQKRNYLLQIPYQILRQIKSLRLNLCYLDQKGFENLAECIPYLHSLTSLDISKNPGGDGSLVKLLHALKKHGKLQTLSMQHVAMGINDVAGLADLVQPSSSLRELTIGNPTHHYLLMLNNS